MYGLAASDNKNSETGLINTNDLDTIIDQIAKHTVVVWNNL